MTRGGRGRKKAKKGKREGEKKKKKSVGRDSSFNKRILPFPLYYHKCKKIRFDKNTHSCGSQSRIRDESSSLDRVGASPSMYKVSVNDISSLLELGICCCVAAAAWGTVKFEVAGLRLLVPRPGGSLTTGLLVLSRLLTMSAALMSVMDESSVLVQV